MFQKWLKLKLSVRTSDTSYLFTSGSKYFQDKLVKKAEQDQLLFVTVDLDDRFSLLLVKIVSLMELKTLVCV